MNDEDYHLYQQAVVLANTGQVRQAYDQFCLIRSHGNEDVAMYFWIVATTANPVEAQSTLDMIEAREPNHPSLHDARIDHARKLQRAQLALQPTGPVIQCPVCQRWVPIAIKRKVATGGWIVLGILLGFGILFFMIGLLSYAAVAGLGMLLGLVSLVGLLIREEYRACSSCGVRLG